LMDRALEIADHIMTQPRVVRRMSTQVVRRPWKQRLANDLEVGWGMQMFAHVAKEQIVHERERVGSALSYVSEGRRTSFDKS